MIKPLFSLRVLVERLLRRLVRLISVADATMSEAAETEMASSP